MSFISRLGNVAKGFYHGLTAPLGFAYNLVTSPWSSDAEENGVWHGIYHAATSGAGDAVSQMVRGFFGSDQGLGAAIGGLPQAVRSPVREVGSGLNWTYNNAISRPLSTAFTAVSIADQQPGLADSWETLFKGSTWSRAYSIAQHRSPGQSAVLGLTNYSDRLSGPERYLAAPFGLNAFTPQTHPVDVTNEHDVDTVKNEDWYKFSSGTADAMTRWYLDPLVLGGRAAGAARIKYVKPVGYTGDATQEADKYIESDRYSRFVNAVAKTKNAAEIRSQLLPTHPEGQALAAALDLARHDPKLMNDVMRTGFGDYEALGRVGDRNAFLGDMLANKLGPKQAMLINLTNGTVPDSYAVLPAANRISFADRAAMVIRPLDQANLDALRGSLQGFAQPRDALANRARTIINQKSLYGTTLVTRVLPPYGAMPRLLDLNRADSDLKLRSYLANTPIDPQRQNELLSNFINAGTPDAKFQAALRAENEAAKSLAIKHGLDPADADKIVQQARLGHQGARSALANSQKFISDAVAAKVPSAQVQSGLDDLARTVIPDETGTVLTEIPMLSSQLADYMPLVDLRRYERALKLNQAGWLASKVGDTRDLSVESLDSLTRFWKAGALLRLGWPQRVIGDEGLRMMAMLGAVSTLKFLRPGLSNVAMNARDRWFPAWAKTQEARNLLNEQKSLPGLEQRQAEIEQYRADNPALADRPYVEPPFVEGSAFARPFANAQGPDSLEEALSSGLIGPADYVTTVRQRASQGLVPPHEATVYQALRERNIDRGEFDRNVLENGLHTAGADRFTDPRWQADLAQRAAAGERITVDPLTGDEYAGGHSVRLPGHETTVPDQTLNGDHLYDFVHAHLDALTRPESALGLEKTDDGVRLSVQRLHEEAAQAEEMAKGFGTDTTDLSSGTTSSHDVGPLRPQREIAADLRDLERSRMRGYQGLKFRSELTGKVYVADGAYQGDGQIYHQLASSHPAWSYVLGQQPPNTWASLLDRDAQILHNRMRATGVWKNIRADDPEYPVAWERAATQLAADPLAQRFLMDENEDQALQWLEHTPDGRAHMRSMPTRAHDPESWAAVVKGMVDEYIPPAEGLREQVLSGNVSHAALADAVEPNLRPDVHGEQLALALGKSRVSQLFDKAVQAGYRKLGTVPTDTLVRHPFFSERYGQYLNAFISQDERFAQQAGKELTFADTARAERRARERALTDLRNRFYDLTSESNFAGAIRFLSPFYGAWKESLTAWGKIATEKPQVLPRFWEAWNAPDAAGMTEHRDGEQYVMMPQWITDKVPGVPKGTPVGFNKQSFNLAMQISPGAGPVAAIPVNEIAKDRPELSNTALVKWVLPFGPTANPLQLVLPATYQRLYSTEQGLNDRSFAGTVASIMASDQVDYNLGKRTTKPTYSEAVGKARNMYMLRAVANFTLPGSPKFNSPYQPYIDAYRALKQKDPQHADQIFYERYGDTFFPLTQTVSQSVDGVPASMRGYQAAKKYGALIDQHPEIGGLIAGNDGAGSFSQAVYEYQLHHRLDAGSSDTERRILSPKERVQNADARLGWIKYTQAMDAIDAELADRGLTSIQQRGAEDLQGIKVNVIDKLSQQLPAWRDDFDSTDAGKMRRTIEGMRAIVQDPRLLKRPEIQGVADYLSARDAIQRELLYRKANGDPGSLNARKNADLADLWAHAVGSIVQDNVSFAQTYHRYLSNDTLEF